MYESYESLLISDAKLRRYFPPSK